MDKPTTLAMRCDRMPKPALTCGNIDCETVERLPGFAPDRRLPMQFPPDKRHTLRMPAPASNPISQSLRHRALVPSSSREPPCLLSYWFNPSIAHSKHAGQQRGAVFEAHHGARRCTTLGRFRVQFV
ncbi:MAG: hypothetical protein ABIR34_02410, partial [Marmoricola sp.]